MAPLILLFGLPRSGTTWLGKIFDSHPDTLYRHEPDSWGRFNDVPLLVEGADFNRYAQSSQAFVATLRGKQPTKVSATVPVFPKRFLSESRYLVTRATVTGWRLAARALGELNVPQWVDAKRLAGVPLVWKSVESIGRLAMLCTQFPASRATLILRHPCGQVNSILRGEARNKFTGADQASEDIGVYELLAATPTARRYGITSHSLKQQTPLQRLAWRWVLFNETAIDDVTGLSNCRVVRYEDVCESPISVIRQLFEFSGLPWQEQTESFVTASVDHDSRAYYSVFKNPVQAAHRWRSQLDSSQIEEVMDVIRNTRAGAYYPED